MKKLFLLFLCIITYPVLAQDITHTLEASDGSSAFTVENSSNDAALTVYDDGDLITTGAVIRNVTTVTADYEILDDDFTLIYSYSGTTDLNLYLPTSVETGKIIYAVKPATTNSYQVDIREGTPGNSDHISYLGNTAGTAPDGCVIQFNGTSWWITGFKIHPTTKSE